MKRLIIFFVLITNSILSINAQVNADNALRLFSLNEKDYQGFVMFMDKNVKGYIRGHVDCRVYFRIPITGQSKLVVDSVDIEYLEMKSQHRTKSDSIYFRYWESGTDTLSEKEKLFLHKYNVEFQKLFSQVTYLKENIFLQEDIVWGKKYGNFTRGANFLIVPFKKIRLRKYPYFKRFSEKQVKRFNAREKRRAAKY